MSKKYEVVISGISGRFPECGSFDELEEKLFGKINMVGEGNCRWPPGEYNVPAHIGKLKCLHELDATFFGIHGKLKESLDPVAALGLQSSYEAICDAGINPSELFGSNTAVFMASNCSDAEYAAINSAHGHYIALLGISKCFQANRISNYFNLQGPSIMMEAAQTGGLQVIQEGYSMISRGLVRAAIVGCSGMAMRPEVSLHLQGLSRLTSHNKTKSFSADADGFNRSECCVIFFLQRADDAKRSYGTIVNVVNTYGGSRQSGFLESCQASLTGIISSAYSAVDIDPSHVNYVEADGSAILNSDATELNSIGEVFCKSRGSPLLVGSIKSNLGHTEEANAFTSLAKAIIVLKNRQIPPNLHYTAPNPLVRFLTNGEMKVVTESTKLEGNIVGVNVMGLVGAYGHIILQQKSRSPGYMPEIAKLPLDGIPRLIILSGRDENKLRDVLTKIESKPIHEGFCALTHHTFRKDIYKHLYRGYTLLHESLNSIKEIKPYQGGKKRPVWFVFSGMGSQWPGMGIELLKLPVFAESIKKCQKVLQSKGINLYDILTTKDETIFDNILNSFVAIAAFQIALVDLLHSLGVKPDGIVGHSVGEMGCAYADGCFTAEEMILASYYRGRASIETKLIRGMMAAVGMGYNEIKDNLPPTIEVACHNSKDSCTLSGPEKDMEEYISSLKKKGIFAKLVNVSNLAYHSKHIAPAGPKLLAYLKQILPHSRPRTKRWISSSVPESEWGTDLAKFSSAIYHTNNLLGPVLFEEACKHIPSDAICIEIAPHGLLQAILRRSLNPKCTNIPLTNRTQKNGLIFLLCALGRMYNSGIDMDLTQIYPEVKLPVEQGTPFMSSLLTWDFSTYQNNLFKKRKLGPSDLYKSIAINLSGEDYELYSDLKMQEDFIVPASKYLSIVLEMFSKINLRQENIAISLKNIIIKRFIKVIPKCDVKICIQIQRGTGEFEIAEEDNNDAIMSGIVSLNESFNIHEERGYNISDSLIIRKEDFYEYLRQKGLVCGNKYQNILEMKVNSKGFRAKIACKGNMTVFLENLMSSVCVFNGIKNQEIHTVNTIKTINIDTVYFSDMEEKVLSISYDAASQILKCKGIEIHRLETKALKSIIDPPLSITKEEFIPYWSAKLCVSECASRITQILAQNLQGKLENVCFLQLISKPCTYFNKIKSSFSELYGFDVTFSSTLNQRDKVIIFADEHNCDKAMRILGNRNGFLMLAIEPEFLEFKEMNLTIVSNQSNKYFLIKRSIIPKPIVIFTNKRGWEGEAKKIYETILEGETNLRLYIVTISTEINAVRKIINKCVEIDGEHVRFVFLDEKAPKFDFSLALFKNWLMKDLKINIFWNGIWGSIQEIELLNYQQDTTEEISKFILSKDTNLSYIGIDGNDVTGSPTLNDELKVSDYSGIDENGVPVFGVGYLNHGRLLKTDSILKWKIPSSWSHEEAATVPVPYSIAYMIMVVLGQAEKGENVMIHGGYLPVSFAAIRIALSLGCNVYTSYCEKNQYELIQNYFPEITKNQIFYWQDGNIIDEVLMKKKFDLILNVYSGKRFEKSLITCQKNCRFFHLGKKCLKQHEQLGMLVFLSKKLSLYGVDGNLEVINNSLKKEIYIAVSNGIQTGNVVPLPFTKYSGLFKKQKAIYPSVPLNEIKQFGRIIVPKKEIFKTLEYESNYDYRLNLMKSYLVIGNPCEFLFSLLEWLLKTKENKVLLFLQGEISNFDLHRLEIIISKFEENRITFIDWKDYSKSKQSLNPELQELQIAFVMFTENDTLLKEMSDTIHMVSPKCKVVYFSQSNDFSDDSRGINIVFRSHVSSSNDTFIKLSNILPNLDVGSLLYVSEIKDHKVSSPTIENGSLFMLPKTFDELESLRSETNECGFDEIVTRSPPFKANKELCPVFIISGLRPALLQPLISKLIHPAFLAKIPNCIQELEVTANALVKELLQFDMRLFTIIAADWGGALALLLGKLLETEGRKAKIIMLNASPHTIKSSLQQNNLDSDINLLKQYFTLPSMVNKSMENSSSWEDKLRIAVSTEQLEGKMKGIIKESISVLRNRIKTIVDFPQFIPKFNGYICLVKPKSSCEYDKCNLQENCSGKIVINISEKEEYGGLIGSWRTANFINDSVLIESRDAVDYLKFYHHDKIIQDNTFCSPGIERV